MGKYLLINTADFSNVAVNQVTPTPIQPEHEMEPYKTVFGYVMAINTGIIEDQSGGGGDAWKLYYVPIETGKQYHLIIEWSSPHLMRVGTLNEIPSLGKQATLLINDTTDEYPSGRNYLDYTYTSQLNGYLLWNIQEPDLMSCIITEK